MQEKERLLAKPDLSDEDGARLGELEGVIAEETATRPRRRPRPSSKDSESTRRTSSA